MDINIFMFAIFLFNFQKHNVCATCGCKCLERTSELLALLS